ncbi:MAG: hypothetical protein QM729_21290 [Solirubrobacterales bacterium]
MAAFGCSVAYSFGYDAGRTQADTARTECSLALAECTQTEEVIYQKAMAVAKRWAVCEEKARRTRGNEL